MKRMLGAIFASCLTLGWAQDASAEEIISGYFENIGGEEAWSKIEGFKISAEVNQGMIIPIELVKLKDGKQYTKVSVQGMDVFQEVYDGETLWGTNFMTMKAEKSDAETTANYKLDINDFPDDLLHYKKKGYTVEVVGTETFEGTETYKVKLTKEPKTIDGNEVEDTSFYYFDQEALVPLASESEIKQGQAKGQIQQVKFGDYQEVDGLYFPFSISQGIKGGQSASVTIKTIELNPKVDPSMFAMPEPAPETTEEKKPEDQ